MEPGEEPLQSADVELRQLGVPGEHGCIRLPLFARQVELPVEDQAVEAGEDAVLVGDVARPPARPEEGVARLAGALAQDPRHVGQAAAVGTGHGGPASSGSRALVVS